MTGLGARVPGPPPSCAACWLSGYRTVAFPLNVSVSSSVRGWRLPGGGAGILPEGFGEVRKAGEWGPVSGLLTIGVPGSVSHGEGG